MKDSLLYVFIKFILSRYHGSITARFSPKLIIFFQTMYILSPKFYHVFSNNFGDYNGCAPCEFEAS